VIGASLLFVALAVAARLTPYFPIDLEVTRAVQADHGPVFDRVMEAMSWVGYEPQVWWIGLAAVMALFLFGLRWEAVAAAFAGAGILAGGVVKLIVERPRPTPDLVHIVRQVGAYSFPSGHVVMATTFLGFLAFLAFTLLKPSWWRRLIVGGLVGLVLLMGPSRIDQGHHWFSDVIGAYVLGSLWLALSIRIYRWGKPRFFVHQPVAPEAPAREMPARGREGTGVTS
jgi:undecaprenyl-diphosphatase